MLLKLSIYFCSLLHPPPQPHSTQHLGIQIWGQRNEKHDKVAAAWLSRQTINQHAVPPLHPLSPRRHHTFNHQPVHNWVPSQACRVFRRLHDWLRCCCRAGKPAGRRIENSFNTSIQASCTRSVSRWQDSTRLALGVTQLSEWRWVFFRASWSWTRDAGGRPVYAEA